MWTQNKLFQPQNPTPEGDTMPRPQDTVLSNELSAREIARVLSALAFNQAQDRKRVIHLSRLARDKIVSALNLASLGQPLDNSEASLSESGGRSLKAARA